MRVKGTRRDLFIRIIRHDQDLFSRNGQSLRWGDEDFSLPWGSKAVRRVFHEDVVPLMGEGVAQINHLFVRFPLNILREGMDVHVLRTHVADRVDLLAVVCLWV